MVKGRRAMAVAVKKKFLVGICDRPVGGDGVGQLFDVVDPPKDVGVFKSALQFPAVALDQAAENSQLFDLAFFFFFQGGQDLLDAFFLGVADKAAGVDDQPIGVFVFGNDFHSALLSASRPALRCPPCS